MYGILMKVLLHGTFGQVTELNMSNRITSGNDRQMKQWQRYEANNAATTDLCPRAFVKLVANSTFSAFFRLVASVRAGKGG